MILFSKLTFNKILLALLFLIVFHTFTVYSVGKCSIVPQKEDDILRLSMCSDDCKSECKHLLHSFGHAFILIENLTNTDVYFYKYRLKARDSATFSWWAVDEHMGVWFNIESNYIHLKGRYDNLRSISMYIGAADIAKLSEFIKENDKYSPISNCSKNVVKCWNTIAEPSEKITESLIMTPAKLINEMTRFGTPFSMPVELNTDICYFDGNDRMSFTMEG